MKPVIHILHINNNPADTKLVQVTLEKAGIVCRIIRVQARAEFDAALRQGGQDIILADYHLSMCNGISALKLAQELCPETPFIFVSDTVGEEAVIEALTQGATDYVLKHNMSRLGPAVKQALQKAQARREHEIMIRSLADSKAKMDSILENIGIGVALISPNMEILDLNKRMREWFPNIDPSQHPICYKAFNTPPRSEICSYCPTCKTLKDGKSYESTTETPQDGETRNYRIISTPILNATREIVAAIEMVEDITDRKQAEEKMFRADQRLRLHFEQSPLGFLEWDENFCAIEWNDACEQIFGYTREEAIGRHAKDLILHPEVHELVDGIYHSLMNQTGGQHSINENITKDGRIITCEWFNTPLTDQDNKVIGVASVCSDITERKRAEENYKLLFESIPDDAFVLDRDWRYVVTNRSSWDRTSFSRDDLIGNRIMDVYPNITETALWQSYVDAMEERIPVRIETEFTFDTGECGWYEIRMLPVPEGILVISRDITERKQTEKDLKESYEIINRSPAVVFLWKNAEDWPVEYVSENVKELFGYTSKELMSGEVPFAITIHPDDLERVGKEVSTYTQEKGRKEFTQEYRIITKDGNIRDADDRTWIRRNEKGEITHYQGIVLDITERKQAEEKALELERVKLMDKARSELLSDVSHELRTPLATIKGHSSMLLGYWDKLKAQEKRESVSTIEHSADRLKNLVDDLLDMSRLEAGLIRLEKEDTSVAQIIKDAVKETLAYAPKYTIQMKIAKQLPSLMIDAKRIRQVLDNLLSNAVKYSEEGTSIIVKAVRKDDEIIISVTDQGMGISPEESERVFDRFYRIPQRLSPTTSGAGLGLAICMKLMEAHGGRIWVESCVGKGSTFFFTLPLFDKEEPEHKQ